MRDDKKIDFDVMLNDCQNYTDDQIKNCIDHLKKTASKGHPFEYFVAEKLDKIESDKNHKRVWDIIDIEDKKNIIKLAKHQGFSDWKLFFTQLNFLDNDEIHDCLTAIKKNHSAEVIKDYYGNKLFYFVLFKQTLGNHVKYTEFHDLIILDRLAYIVFNPNINNTTSFTRLWNQLSIEDRGIVLLGDTKGEFVTRCIERGISYDILFDGQCDLVKLYAFTDELLGALRYSERSFLQEHWGIVVQKVVQSILKIVQMANREDQQKYIKLFEKYDICEICGNQACQIFADANLIYDDKGYLSSIAKETIDILKSSSQALKRFISGALIISCSDLSYDKVVKAIHVLKDNPLAIKEILSCIKTEYPQHFKAVKKDKSLKQFEILNWNDQDFNNALQIISMSGDSEVSGPLHSYLEYKSSGATKAQPSTDYKAVLCDLMVRLTPNELSMLSSAVGLEESNGVNVKCSFLAKVSQSKIKASLKRKIQKSFARNHDPDVKDVLKKSP